MSKCEGEQSSERQQRQRAPEEPSVVWRYEHTPGVGGGPHHFLLNHRRRTETTLEREVRDRLRQKTDRDHSATKSTLPQHFTRRPFTLANSSPHGHHVVDRRPYGDEQILFADHPHERRERTEKGNTSGTPFLPHVQPYHHKRCDGKCRVGVREAGSNVHVEHERRSEADSCQHACRYADDTACCDR